MRSRKGWRRTQRSRIYLNRIARELWPDSRKENVRYWDRSTQPIGDVITWANSLESRRLGNGIVAQTRIGPQWLVSTVWLGIDHNFCPDGPPLIFKTMAFTGGEPLRYGGIEWRWRWTYEREAKIMHRQICHLAHVAWNRLSAQTLDVWREQMPEYFAQPPMNEVRDEMVTLRASRSANDAD